MKNTYLTTNESNAKRFGMRFILAGLFSLSILISTIDAKASTDVTLFDGSNENQTISEDTVQPDFANVFVLGESDTTYEASALEDLQKNIDHFEVKDNTTVTVNGDLNLSKKMYIGEKSTLVVNGNYTSGEYVQVKKAGTLTVNGNYTQTDDQNYLRANAIMNVTGNYTVKDTGYVRGEESAKFIIGGDVIYSSTSDMKYNSSQWELAGNLQHYKDAGFVEFNKLKLTGENATDNIPKLTLQSNSKVVNLATTDSVQSVDITGYLKNTTFDNDMTVHPVGDLSFYDVNIGGNTITINGDMFAAGRVEADKNSNLIVNGNYTQDDKALNLDTNSVMTVNGDMVISNTGRLGTDNKTAKAIIDGDFTYSSTTNMLSNSSQWEIAGNITQGNDAGSIEFNKLLLTGTKAADGQPKLVLGSESQIKNLATADTVESVSITGYLKETTFDNDMTIKPVGNLSFNVINIGGKTITIDGDMLAEGNIVIDKNSNLIVNGDYIQENANLTNGLNSTMKVNGNVIFRNTGRVASDDSTAKIMVDGNFTYTSTQNMYYNSSKWEIAGNIEQGEDAGSIEFSKLTLTGTKVAEGNPALNLRSNSQIKNLSTSETVGFVGITGYLKRTTFDNDMTVKPVGDLIFNDVHMGGNTITVDGDMFAEGNVEIDKSANLIVNGNYTQDNGGLTQRQNSTMTVNGNALFSNTGIATSNDSTAKAVIDGNVVYTSTKNMYDNSSKWEIAGNIEQVEDAGSVEFNKLLLTGSKATEGNPNLVLKSNSRIQNLATSATVGFVGINGYLKETSFDNNMTVKPVTSCEFSDLNINGKTITIDGDMNVVGAVSVSDNSTLIVNDNLIISNEVVYMGQNSLIKVLKDCVIKDTGCLDAYNNSAKVLAGKDFVYTSVKDMYGSVIDCIVDGNVLQGESAGSLNFDTLQMCTKGSSVTLPNGKINNLILAGKKSEFTITPEGCYTTLKENGNPVKPDPKPDDPKPDDPKPEISEIEGGDGATDTQPSIDNTTTELTLVKGQKFTLLNMDWTSSNTSVLTASKGNITAKNAGSAKLSRKGQEINVTVIAPTVDKADKTLKLVAGETDVKLNLKGVPEDQEILYVSDNPDIATVDDNGNVSAVSKGNANITAYVSGVAYKFSVKSADADTSKRDFTKEVNLVPNQTVLVKLNGFNAKKAVWSSDKMLADNDIPKGYVYADDVVKINKAGKITAIGDGTTTITATEGSASPVTIAINVSEPAKQTIHLNVGKSKTLKLYGVKGKLDYDNDDSGVVSINGNKFTGSKAGTSVVRTSYEGFDYEITVIVEDPKIEKAGFTGKPYSYTIKMNAGDEETIAFNNVEQDVIFISSKNSIAYCDPDLKIHARSKGKAKLTAKVNGTKVTINVVVQ